MKIKSNDHTVSKKQGIANIGFNNLQELRCRVNEMNELKPYLDKDALWILGMKIDACNEMIRRLQDVIHTLSNIAPTINQL